MVAPVEPSGREPTRERQLHAEAALDRGLVEEYDAQMYNRESDAITHFKNYLGFFPEDMRAAMILSRLQQLETSNESPRQL